MNYIETSSEKWHRRWRCFLAAFNLNSLDQCNKCDRFYPFEELIHYGHYMVICRPCISMAEKE